MLLKLRDGIPWVRLSQLLFTPLFRGVQSGRLCSHAAVRFDSFPAAESTFPLSAANGVSMFFLEMLAEFCPGLVRLGD